MAHKVPVAMKKNVPTVEAEAVVWQDGDEERVICVGSPGWYAWLGIATKFYFSGDRGSFTAYRERREQGWYWKAYRRRSGRLYRAYLGKSEALNLQRLNEVASELAGCPEADDAALDKEHKGYCDSRELRPVSSASDVPPPNAQESGRTGREAAAVGGTPLHPPTPEGLLSETRSDVLVRAKLSPPPARPELVRRPRLIGRLTDGLSCKLTLVSAPAGFGKTTLLSQWSQQIDLPVAWLSLDAEDNDPVRFWACFIVALQSVRPHLGHAVLDSLHSPHAPPAESFLAVLVNELAALAEDIIIVLDDYHVIDDRAIHNGMSFLLEHCPDRLRLVIASRADPPLHLSRLRGRAQLNELRAADLGFTVEEAGNFLNEIMQLDLSGEDIVALGQRTEGWIVGLQMAALSMRGRGNVSGFVKAFAGTHRYVSDYLVEEVLRRQPENVYAFLVQTSILDRLSGPLCEAVAGLSDGEGQEMLELLDDANLFTVPMDDERRWYRYHHLFASCLQVHLKRWRPGRIAQLHRKACAWYAEQGLAVEALRHALAAQDFERAAALIEEHGEATLKRYQVETMLGWLRALPDELVRSRPRLCVYQAVALRLKGLPDAAEEWLENAEHCLAANAAGTGRDAGISADVERVLGNVMAGRANLAVARQDLPRAISLLSQVLNISRDPVWRAHVLANLGLAYLWSGEAGRADEVLSEAATISHASADSIAPILTLVHLANVQVMRAQLHQAAKYYRQALQLAAADETALPPAASGLYVGLASLNFEWGDFEVARRYAKQGIELAKEGGVIDLALVGYGVLARLLQAEGELESALEAVEQAEQLARANSVTQGLARVECYRVRVWLKQSNLEAAIRWTKACGLHADDQLSYRREAQHVVLARVLVAEDRPAEAASLLGRLLVAAKSAGRFGSAIKILALESLVQLRLGNTDKALAALASALALAEPGSYLRTFVDEGQPMASLLSELLSTQRGRSLSASDKLPAYARRLMAAFGSSESAAQLNAISREASPAEAPLLSRREREVLRLVAAGHSPSDIAQDLILSINTVRTHIKSIYAKLEVHSGIEAVAKAREDNLL